MRFRKLVLLMVLGSVFLTGCQNVPVKGMLKAGSVFKPTYSTFDGRFLQSTRVLSVLNYVPASHTKEKGMLDVFADKKSSDNIRGFAKEKNDIGDIMAELNIVRVPAFESYIQQKLSRLMAGWTGDMPTVQVHVTSAEGFDAFADGDNNIFLSLGMLRDLQNENEFMSILAHELSHVLLKHFDRSSYFNKQQNTVSALRNLANYSSALSGISVKKVGGERKAYLKNEPAIRKNLTKNTATAMMIQGVSENIWSTSWSRAQEDEADLLAMDLLVFAGYSPKGAIHAMERLEDYQGKQKSRVEAYGDLQQKLLKEAFDKEGIEGIVNQGITSLKTSFELFQKDIFDKFTATHRMTSKRRNALKQYVRREYLTERRRRPVVGDYQSRLLSGSTGRILANHRLANKAIDALSTGDIRTAEKLGLQAIGGETSGAMHTRMAMYLVRTYQGRHGAALGNLRRINDWSLVPIVTYDYMIRGSINQNKLAQASNYLRKGEKKFGLNPMLPLKIAYSVNQNDVAKVEELFSLCQEADDKRIKSQCKSEMGGMYVAYKEKNKKEVGKLLGDSNPLESLSESLGSLFKK